MDQLISKSIVHLMEKEVIHTSKKHERASHYFRTHYVLKYSHRADNPLIRWAKVQKMLGNNLVIKNITKRQLLEMITWIFA